MSADSPFLQVRDFYLTRYRPLYDHFVTNGEVPQELHAEVAGGFSTFSGALALQCSAQSSAGHYRSFLAN